MDTTVLGEQIQKFRKQRGLTQKELGAAVGVSTQAVSQWECGGTPDVALLPAIADRLGVTVDALFGREGDAAQDMEGAFLRWLRTLPESERLTRLSRLLWEAAIYSVNDGLAWAPKIDYPENGEMEMPAFGEGSFFMRAVTGNAGGYILGVGARDVSFMGVFPEPADGYEKYLLPDEAYRTLFGALAMPGAMELLRWFGRGRLSYYVPAVAAEQTGLPLPETERILEAMTEAHLLVRQEITLPQGPAHAYRLVEDGGLVPLLYFARWVWQGNGPMLVGNIARNRYCFDTGTAGEANRDEKPAKA